MKQSIGFVFTIDIIIVFLVVAFVFISGTLSYTKAFKAGSIITNAIEKYEGYNKAAFDEIDMKLSSIGYEPKNGVNCPETVKIYNKGFTNGALGAVISTKEATLANISGVNQNRDYCVYYVKDDLDNNHYNYVITTYMVIDFTMFNTKLRIPMRTRTDRSYRFR